MSAAVCWHESSAGDDIQAVHCRRSSLSSRRCAYLEQATWQRHVCYIAVNLPDTTEDHSVPAIIPRHYSVTLTVTPVVVLAVACHLGHSKNTDWLIDDTNLETFCSLQSTDSVCDRIYIMYCSLLRENARLSTLFLNYSGSCLISGKTFFRLIVWLLE